MCVLAALCLQLASWPVLADVDSGGGSSAPAEAAVDELNSQAVQKFKDKDYDEAIRLFEQAYGLSPEPNYLFNIGRVYEEKGDFPAAIEHYERFVEAPGVEIEARDLALERLRVLRAIMAETEVEQRQPESDEPIESAETTFEPTEPTEPVDTPPATVDEPQPTPKIRIAGYVLLGVGGAVLIAGAGLGGAALAQERDLAQTRGFEARTDLIDRGKQFALAADGLFIAGGAVALTGLVLTLVSLRRGGKHGSRAAVWPTVGPRRAGVAVDLRF